MFKHLSQTISAKETRARRAARRAGLRAVKSRWHKDSVDNYGEFQLRDPQLNFAVGGFQFDMTADEVVEYCAGSGN